MSIYGGVEAGGTKFVCAVGSGPDDLQDEVIFETTSPKETINRTLEYFKKQNLKENLLAIGIGSFGPIELNKESSKYGFVRSTPKPGWININLCGLIKEELKIPVGFNTDVNAAALGEYEWGAGRGLNNFIFDDYSINRDHKNSMNEPNWWSWRAIWALSIGYLLFVNVDKDFAEIIYKSLERITEELKKIINAEKETQIINGKEKITWLPNKSGSDQSSIIILSLLNYYKFSKDETIPEYIDNLCNGILSIQKGNSTNFPYSAFMSWKNLWHAYGNLQSYSLLKASSVLEREEILLAAISEINYFYKFLMNKNYLSSFYIDKKNDEYIPRETKQYSQIAYNFRVMVYACIEAYNITKDSSYASIAGEIASWFFGNNIADAQMYFPSSGICYDGINSQYVINKNSGAESTIEALLTMLAIEQNSISKKALNKYLVQNTN